jgi:ketosteroid isomerase-like protein
MRTLRLSFLPLLFLLLQCSNLHAQAADATSQIKAVMQKSANDWNRGDLNAFATCYKNAPDILIVGATVSRGYNSMVDVYRKGFGTKEKMGTLTFSKVEVQPLDARFATATGHFHLERTSAGGGNADGFYLLVFEKTRQGWKIIRDDSTTLRPPSSN